jgi:SNF2 family DNA or RNA helicase
LSCCSKTENTILVDFSDTDNAEYQQLETKALAFFTDFKNSHGHNLGKHYLKITVKLKPIRMACAGGRIPLDDEIDDEEDESEPRKKCKKVQNYSDFAFTSKLNRLVKELVAAREGDPTGT